MKRRKEFKGWFDRDYETGSWEVLDPASGRYENISDVLYDFDRKYVKIVLEIEEIEDDRQV